MKIIPVAMMILKKGKIKTLNTSQSQSDANLTTFNRILNTDIPHPANNLDAIDHNRIILSRKLNYILDQEERDQ